MSENTINAREKELELINSSNANSFNKNLKGSLAIAILILIVFLIVIELITGNKISDYIWGTILGYGGSTVTYYFGSSDKGQI